MDKPISIDTLGALQRYEYSLTAHCFGCNHSHRLNLDDLVRRYGRDFEIVGRRWPLRCARCGSRDHGMTLSPKDVGPVARSSN